MADKHEDENFIRPCTIPASPNWYCSCAGGCSDNGKYVFGGKNYLFLTDLENLICDSKLTQGYFAAHKERVTAVCLLPDVKEPLEGEYWSLVASGSDDMLVRIWGCETGQKLREHKRHQGKIVAISCALKYPSIIVSGDDKGTIIFWNYVKGLFTQWTPERAEIFCLAASPHEEGVIAVGYGNGHVIVGNISKDEILQEYKSHLDEVHSVVWCPEPGDFLSTWRAELKGGGFLLASGSKDKTIKIWNILDDKPRCNLTLPPISKMPGQKGKRKGFDAQKVRVWMALCWVRETSLLSSSFTGDILAWDLKENDWHPISPGHIRTVFTISHDTRANKLVSTSIDRRIIFWDSNTYEKLDTLPSLGGFVYSATCSMVDPHAVAFGVGDNTIRIWNTRSKGKAYDITQVWQGLKSKITSVCFHPRKEGLLAYGTDDGHVGIYNAISQRIEFSSSYHKKTVYSLSWGPCCRNTSEGDDTGEELKASRLFSCGGEGIIYQHSVSNLKAPAEDINKLIVKANNLKGKTPSRSDVEWKPDLKVVAVGNDDGTIDILCAPQLVRLCIVHVHRKMINCLKWHPHFSLTETENDQHSCLLASGSGDNYVCVTDLGAVLSDMEPSELKITKKFRCFDGHLGRITGVCWNPHTVGMLASSSYDGTVQIWNVLENQLIGNFREHIGRVLCVLWSFLDTDVVYSGGEDNTLRRWKISDTLHKTPPEKKKPSGSQIAKRSVTEPDSNVSRPSSEEAVGDQINDAKYSKKIPKDDPVSQAAVVGTDNLKPESHIRPTNMSTSENAVLESDIPGSSSAEVKPDLSSVKSQGAEKVTSVKPTKSKGANWRRKGKEKPLLPLTGIANDKAKQPSQEECVLLAQYLSGKLKESSNVTASNFQPGTESHINLGLYTDRLSAFRMIDTEDFPTDLADEVLTPTDSIHAKFTLANTELLCQNNEESNSLMFGNGKGFTLEELFRSAFTEL